MAENGNGNGNGRGGNAVMTAVAAITTVIAVLSVVFAINSGSDAEVGLLRDDLHKAGMRINELSDRWSRAQLNAENFIGRTIEQIKRIDDQMAVLRAEDTALDGRLQREMRDLINEVKTAIEGMDTRIQAELRHTTSLLQSTITTQAQAISDNDENQAENRENVSRITEQIRQLEMQLKNITQAKEYADQLGTLLDKQKPPTQQ